jgi:ATP-dependent exoDNAse (exonuclease V) alpha subunit
MIFVGDAYQLPPVVEHQRMNKKVGQQVIVGGGPWIRDYLTETHGGIYFFNPKVYQYTGFKYIELEHIFRQKEDQAAFIRILNTLREDKLSEPDLYLLNQQSIAKSVYDPSEVRISLCARNDVADNENRRKMGQLSTEERTYHAIRTGVYAEYPDIKPVGYIHEKDYPTKKDLALKEGAQIMLLKNDRDKRWVNGTMGVIKHLDDKYIEVEIDGQIFDVEKEEWQAYGYVYNKETKKVSSEVIGVFTQYPVRLAWAISIHKSQGKTFDKITVNLSGGGAFADGQTYVALSRCTSLEGILLTREIKPADIRVDPEIIRFIRDMRAQD